MNEKVRSSVRKVSLVKEVGLKWLISGALHALFFPCSAGRRVVGMRGASTAVECFSSVHIVVFLFIHETLWLLVFDSLW